jgi:hypothetical protein
VEQESPVPPGGLPKPGKLVVTLPDNHLQYALTWYGLAGVLVVSFVTWPLVPGRSRAAPRTRRRSRAFRLPCAIRFSISVARVGARRRLRRAPKLQVNQ